MAVQPLTRSAEIRCLKQCIQVLQQSGLMPMGVILPDRFTISKGILITCPEFPELPHADAADYLLEDGLIGGELVFGGDKYHIEK
jgi:hypothetical protein